MAKKTVKFIQHMSAPNDSNGNPRRLWVGMDSDGNLAQIHDEGYSGKPQEFRSESLIELPGWNITATEYASTIRNAKGDGVFFPS